MYNAESQFPRSNTVQQIPHCCKYAHLPPPALDPRGSTQQCPQTIINTGSCRPQQWFFFLPFFSSPFLSSNSFCPQCAVLYALCKILLSNGWLGLPRFPSCVGPLVPTVLSVCLFFSFFVPGYSRYNLFLIPFHPLLPLPLPILSLRMHSGA